MAVPVPLIRSFFQVPVYLAPFALVRCPDHRHWLPLVPTGQWDQVRLQLTSNAFFNAMGCLFLNSVLPWQQWPWKLAALIDPGVPENQRVLVAREFLLLKDRPCCVDIGFSMKLLQKANTIGDLMSQETLSMISRSFARCPVSNILSEDRFARSGHATRSSTN